jgi:hypothetical protein
MSYLLTYGEGSDDFWMVSNAGAGWLLPLLLEGPKVDADVAHSLEMSWYVHGLDLNDLRAQDADLAERVVGHLGRVAAEILAGRHGLMVAGLRERIADLAARLGRLASAGQQGGG